MGKIIRPTYPKEFSFGLLLLIFVIAVFLSPQLFDVPLHHLHQYQAIGLGMFLVSIAPIIMVLIMWEEILFPIKLKAVTGGTIFRNHRTKLKTQLFIYFTIPTIFIYVFIEYEVHLVRYIIWTVACTLPPILEKIASGITNFNDFLRLTDEEIEYKNNEKVGCFKTADLENIAIKRDSRKVLEKLELKFKNGEEVIIDLDEMELEAFYRSIIRFIKAHYKHLLSQ